MAATRTSLLEDGAVLMIVLDEPKGNVLSTPMMAEIDDALRTHREEKKLKLVVFRGAGGNFSFGASVPEHKKDAAPAMLAKFHALVRHVAGYPVPVASLVEGRCLGGAFELVLTTQLVFATPKAIFACPEIKLGVIPPVLSVLGPSRLGAPLAERMLLTGSELDAERARASGFVTELLPSDRDPEAWLHDWFVANLGSLSAFSLREATWAARVGSQTRTLLDVPLAAAEKRYLERLIPSHDGNEGIEAFLAKRPPKWVDA